MSEIPIYPRQPIIDVGSVEPDGPTSGFPSDPSGIDVQLMEISQSELEFQTPTLEDIKSEIERLFSNGTIPQNYQYYYWVQTRQSTTNSFLDTGLNSQTFYITYNSSIDDQDNGRIGMQSFGSPTEESPLVVKMYFIYHPNNYQSSNPVNEWYFGYAKDNSEYDLEVPINEPYGALQSWYFYSGPERDAKQSTIGLVPWTGTRNETLYPTNGIIIFGSNRLPLQSHII